MEEKISFVIFLLLEACNELKRNSERRTVFTLPMHIFFMVYKGLNLVQYSKYFGVCMRVKIGKPKSGAFI